ncbi:hypothetical protein Ade02nite_28400 [Paractinoplanes deccanensis]|uniref:Rod shape-determining protein MreD n=1 Tax=Paractinoplanes deccanensis TaxID=113561 RepID=A0ABQ3Y2I9_9ACTN|nr:hypothetical protein [Actinoplanes deccanensis]GID74199.1 hypothetical protein Ade02nite_28400 [Actinoplanes deccanensis]
MLALLTRKIAGARTVLTRATVMPFLVRCAIALCGLVAMSVAWPPALLGSQFFAPLALVALYPAVAPRGRGATVAALTVVAGWLVDTVMEDAPVALWRVLTIATALYLGHSLTALAAVLPYDAVVNADVVGVWLARALAVVVISAVLTVAILGLTADLAGSAFLVATLVGLAGAAGATLLIARLVRRM